MVVDNNAMSGPICIVGSVHTGTSLLRNVLDRHPDLFMIFGESHFFQNLVRIQRTYADLQNETTLQDFVDFVLKLAKFGDIKATYKRHEFTIVDLGLSREEFQALVEHAGRAVSAHPECPHVNAFKATMTRFTHLCGKTRWGEKTPVHVYFIDSIVATMPDVRIIELVRDPRAILASRKARSTDQWRTARAASGAIMNEPAVFDPILDSYNWRSAIRAGTHAKRKYPGSVLRVRYEDLVQEPSRIIEEICRFIGTWFDPQMLQVGWVNNTTTIAKSQISPGIGKSAIEKWRASLSAGEIGIVQVILRKEMTLLGYQSVQVGIRGLCEVPVILCRSVISMLSYLRRLIAPRGIQHRGRAKVQRIIRSLIGR